MALEMRKYTKDYGGGAVLSGESDKDMADKSSAKVLKFQ
jgi:hypothetical protein